MSNNISKNVTYTVPTNSDDKKVRYKIDVYILDTVLLVTISLFMMANIYYHYAKYRSKQKNTGTLAIK